MTISSRPGVSPYNLPSGPFPICIAVVIPSPILTPDLKSTLPAKLFKRVDFPESGFPTIIVIIGISGSFEIECIVCVEKEEPINF
jgi:hypothetical protein